ncbi:Ribonuclease 3, partial [Mucuna pruriens]
MVYGHLTTPSHNHLHAQASHSTLPSILQHRQLPRDWSNLERGKTNGQFWEHEWEIHGMCSSNDLKAILRNAKISPGGTYGQSMIINVIKRVIGVEPQLKCYLEEISLCLNTSTIPRYINCVRGRRKGPPLVIFPWQDNRGKFDFTCILAPRVTKIEVD